MVTRVALTFVVAASIGCSTVLGIEDVTYQPSTDGTVDSASSETTDGSDDSDAPASDTAPSCPDSGRGPTMVRLTKGTGSYCIDTTEVTQEQYVAFEADKTMKTVADRCKGATYAPLDHSVDHPGSDYPRANVNWCEAYSFCAWAGKRLCGAIGGGADSLGSVTGEWAFACTGPTGNDYPYGKLLDETRCAVGKGTYDDSGVVSCDVAMDFSRVGSHPTCVGPEAPFSQILDLSGNVAEWVNACGLDGGIEKCAVRGGNIYDCGPGAGCLGEGAYVPFNAAAADRLPAAGIRCCAD
ncbi:MAG: formylglycine-generating enzyme family protein [Polyangiales bacterium]